MSRYLRLISMLTCGYMIYSKVDIACYTYGIKNMRFLEVRLYEKRMTCNDCLLSHENF